MYTMYANASNNTSSYTHVILYVVCKVHHLGFECTRPLSIKRKLVISFVFDHLANF